MALIWSLLALVCWLYILALIGRMVFGWVQTFARDWRPKGAVLVLAEAIYTITDPPLKFLSRLIPPLRIGAISLDIGFTILFFVVVILANSFAWAAAVAR